MREVGKDEKNKPKMLGLANTVELVAHAHDHGTAAGRPGVQAIILS